MPAATAASAATAGTILRIGSPTLLTPDPAAVRALRKTRLADRAPRAATAPASPAERAASMSGEIENDGAAATLPGIAEATRGGRALLWLRAHAIVAFAA